MGSAARQAIVIGAPSAIGLRPYDSGGVRNVSLAPRALRECDLIARLNATDLGDVSPPAGYADLLKPDGRGRNEADVASFSRKLGERIGDIVDPRRFILLLGGDCSILLGALLGTTATLNRPVGVVYIDAHADFATLDESPSGSACSMNLALAVGRSATPLARLRGEESLVRGEHVVHVGRRDDTQPEYGYPALAGWGILDLSQELIRRVGVSAIASQALEQLAPLDAFWIHFDVDVLDPQLMPAVDTPIGGGLDFSEAFELLVPLVLDPRALGLQLTIYDPSLDSGAGASHLARLLASVVREGLRNG